jgi:acylphosphatase
VEIARRYFVSGRVQGVGFRYFVQEAARREGICGWVRNDPDGRVEAFAQGAPDAMARFEARLRSGPSMSRVASVDVQNEQTASGFSAFEIRSTGG